VFKEYFLNIEKIITSHKLILLHQIKYRQLSPSTGYIKTEITFLDFSQCAIFEFIRIENQKIKIEKYRYHYMNSHNRLLFRYDNASHYNNVNTYPHHKHISHTEVIPSTQKSFSNILSEIEKTIIDNISKK
jgi:hypothetical protein